MARCDKVFGREKAVARANQIALAGNGPEFGNRSLGALEGGLSEQDSPDHHQRRDSDAHHAQNLGSFGHVHAGRIAKVLFHLFQVAVCINPGHDG